MRTIKKEKRQRRYKRLKVSEKGNESQAEMIEFSIASSNWSWMVGFNGLLVFLTSQKVGFFNP